MMNQETIIAAIKKQGMLPLFYHADKTVCIETVKALYAAGIRIIEFTNRGEAALENFKALVAAKQDNMQDLVLAIGTIKTTDEAEKFKNAGADFLISPVFEESVCNFAKTNNLLWIPGCMTPTEIHVAEKSGCKMVKLFPGNVLGPSFVSGIRELFPFIDIMPTGGVEAEKENLQAWFAAGVCAVGMGSKLITKKILETKEYASLENSTKTILLLITSIRN